MIKYELKNNAIEIFNKTEFNPRHILECGQIFRFKQNEKGNFEVLSGSRRAEIIEVKSGYKILTTEPEYFVSFFNLETDYEKIKQEINKLSPVVENATKSAYGLRILKQELFETIVSFIISANNNIKRIKLIIGRLCEKLGTNMGDFFAFPTPEQMAGQSAEFFKSIGAGYRAPYLAEVATAYSLLIKEDLSALSDIELRKKLLQIKGVGPKVADCILLFAFNRLKIFPVDVWMERVYYENFGTKKMTRPQISNFLTEKFGDNSGYIQQYMFYSKTVKI